MSAVPPIMLRLPSGDGWVSAVLVAPPSPRGAVLLVPPLLHEWQRGYRLFALLADALAARGVAMLRFDYRGCGDSSGEDETFLPSHGVADAGAMLGALAQRVARPAVVLAVRAGALLADRMALSPGARLWHWQAVCDGGDYLRTLGLRHRHECDSRRRYPFLGRDRGADPGELMGHRVHPDFGAELGALRLASRPALRIDAADAPARADVVLPGALSRWVDELDIASPFPLPMVRALADRLAAEFDA